MIFEQHKNFELNTTGWGQAQPEDIVTLLQSVIIEFYAKLDLTKLPNTPVLVCSDRIRKPPTGHPEIIKDADTDRTKIFLSSKDLFWSQYSYQFSHELCHYVINMPYPPKNDKFGWFEESLCELASIYTLSRMANSWQTNPPYSNWQSYAESLEYYVNNILSQPENTLNNHFGLWLDENLLSLYENRYKRVENRIVAIHLLPIFKESPNLWATIQYINEIRVTDNMTFESYLYEWEKLIPRDLRQKFPLISELLLNVN